MIDNPPERPDGVRDGRFTLNMPSALVSISVSRSVVRRVVTFRDADAESSFLVALTEIVANAIDEHVRIGRDTPVVLDVRFGNEEMVQVTDSGDGFDPTVPATPAAAHVADSDASELSERGRGLLLARALVPAIEIETSTDGTVVTLPLAGFGIIR